MAEAVVRISKSRRNKEYLDMNVPTVFETCQPREDVLSGTIAEADFAADLAQGSPSVSSSISKAMASIGHSGFAHSCAEARRAPSASDCSLRRGSRFSCSIQRSGIRSLRGIARVLAARGIPTARGGTWTAVQVSDILRRPG
jgi:hypothetical protein